VRNDLILFVEKGLQHPGKLRLESLLDLCHNEFCEVKTIEENSPNN
jgi:hypothetical protein